MVIKQFNLEQVAPTHENLLLKIGDKYSMLLRDNFVLKNNFVSALAKFWLKFTYKSTIGTIRFCDQLIKCRLEPNMPA